jgi:hypothetical protein
MKNIGNNKSDTIWWIEKLLQMPIADHRKYAMWKVIMPYLFNIRKLSDSEATNLAQTWLDRCAILRPLDFNSKYLVKQNIRNRYRNRYLPINTLKLSVDNPELYAILFDVKASTHNMR